MNDLKLTRVLKTLNQKEFRKFGEFVQSPYFNKNKHVIALFEAISAYYPEFENRNFTAEKIYLKTFKGVKFDNAKFKNYI